MKLATWNVALPVAERRRKALRSYTDTVTADVWVLTETHDGFSVGMENSHSSAPGRDGRHAPEHRWVTIWSNFRLEPIETADPMRTACARVSPPDADPFIVYGTVLPWLRDAWRDYPAKGGVAFSAAVELQQGDWRSIHERYPDHEFFLMGDLNQDLADSHYYGSKANREKLRQALETAGLVALTCGANDPVRRDSAPWACIDHICARYDSAWVAEAPERWPDAPAPVRSLTDHFGISVQLRRG